eukprot:CAMPEP_0113682826 /NCGR_PEP_ID=MMETSP0038_2-20120614/12904_1 /TAXON_ID=2898 /ORGANISM="Cryptomonas paramecium" /LENGTH=463 /DNA_ID=CAMNT_0000601989 /DNA_START=413 /DNA_END=1805 /DNA_ORIENTATION=- /assembly_acc=CAM_ASM_000170
MAGCTQDFTVMGLNTWPVHKRVDLCYKQHLTTCPDLLTSAEANGVATIANNNFQATVNAIDASSCYFGWFQRDSAANALPDVNVGAWTDSTKTSNVGNIVGSQLQFQLGIPFQATVNGATSTWFTTTFGGDFTMDIDIVAVEDPGLPLNMTLSRTFAGGSTCAQSYCRNVAFTPVPSQQGATWQAHFIGRSQCCANGECRSPVFSNLLSVFLTVNPPVSRWSADTLALASDPNVTVGEAYLHMLQCITYSGVPTVRLASASLNGAPTASAMGLDLARLARTAANVTCDYGNVTNPLKCTASAEFAVTPVAGDEGSVREWCVECSDASGVGPAQTKCVRLTTNLCEYQVQAGDTLRSIARRYYEDAGWLRLFNANPTLMDPDLGHVANPYDSATAAAQLLAPGTILRLRPVYSVRQGDTLTSIAGVFETTVKTLVRTNPHVAQDGALRPGVDLCILACSHPAVA